MNAAVEIVLHTTKDANQVYADLHTAFDIFNAELFNNSLPAVLFTLTRKKNTLGYFWADRFKVSEQSKHEIAINPSYFIESTPDDTAFTLLHEMVHLWQQVHGTPSRSGYHNRQWAAKMKEVGLQPTASDGSGAETGQKMTHYPIEGGRAVEVLKLIMAAGYKRAIIEKPLIKAKPKSTRHKYICETCKQKAYGSKNAYLLCGRCNSEMSHDS